ncbi:hypothetical protein [Chitinophaga ginsengisoli]|uniref:ParB-like nuclease family protein n=1 Tax=Chitinophaga ginsengisoli TaxID=363837 RepID=A0A2P8G0W1_9BACT|nr:hypothetical protein [Chitinophaga ginsengisoli]PSL27535.1 hypothetical protein CLV42_10969 [Chitinophaga ginsengisoli]
MKNSIWLDDPEEHDYPAAQDYLELLFEPAEAAKIVARLKQAKTISKKSKDILRASKLPLLPKENVHVQIDLKKFSKEKRLSPLLLVRHESGLIIADGYHRMCASYYLTEDLDVLCRLV